MMMMILRHGIQPSPSSSGLGTRSTLVLLRRQRVDVHALHVRLVRRRFLDGIVVVGRGAATLGKVLTISYLDVLLRVVGVGVGRRGGGGGLVHFLNDGFDGFLHVVVVFGTVVAFFGVGGTSSFLEDGF